MSNSADGDSTSETTPPVDSPEEPDSIKKADKANGEGDPED